MAINKRMAIFGCGALGGYVGGYLTRAGHDVTMIDPWPEHVAIMQNPGIRLEGLTEPENFQIKTNAILTSDLPSPNQIEPFDIIFIAVKSFDTEDAIKTMAPYLSDDGFAVSLQNGINEDKIAAVVGQDRTIGCIASTIAVSLPAAGHIKRMVKLGGTAHIVFRVGEIDGQITERITTVADMLSVIDSAMVTENLMGERWSKLATNALRNPIAAARDQGSNQNDRDPHIRNLAIRIAAEAIQVAEAEGASLVKIAGVESELLLAAGTGDEAAYNAVTEKFFAAMERRSDTQRPSMAQDVNKGRRTEIDQLNGFIVERAKKHDIATPANEAIIAVIKQIEAGDISPSPDNLDHIK